MKKLSLNQKEELNCYFYLIPGFILMIVFVVVPVVYSLIMSFYHIKSLGADWSFIRFENYIKVFQTRGWAMALLRTVLYGGYGIIIGLVFGLLLAFFVAKHKLLGVFRYLFYLPSVCSAIAMGRIWSYMFMSTDSGLVNTLLMNLNIIDNPINFYGIESNLVGVILITALYGAGGGMTLVLYTTAINNVDGSIIESAILEGATSTQIAFYIELPELKPLITANVILGVVGAFKGFEGMYALSPNSSATETIGVLLYKESLYSSQGYGLASAMGVVITLLVMVIMVGYMYFPVKKGEKV